jgi:hypothetical protein
MSIEQNPTVEVWRYSHGDKPYTVAAFERPDRDGEVWLRWSNPAKPSRDKREYRKLTQRVRPEAGGPLDRYNVQLAERAVHDQYARLRREHCGAVGVRPAAPEPSPARVTPLTLVDHVSALTLRAGFDMALQEKNGKYFSKTSRRYRDMVGMSKRLFGDDGTARLIDPETTWNDFGVSAIRAMRREMAARYLASGGKEFGMRKAEVFIDAIYTVASFLREQGEIGSTIAIPVDNWRENLRLEWSEETGQRRRKSQPRHTPAEYRKIFAALNDPRVDPRIATAIEWAGELRTGQVLVCTRSLLELPDVDPALYDAMPAGSLGSIDVPGKGKKSGELVVFTPEQRRAADRALAGYLSKYEAAYQAGLIKDYPLFPGARMRRTNKDAGPRRPCRVRANVKSMNRTGARIAFHELERIAGVKPVPGRAWYGLRRVATDMAEALTQDERVKNAVGGWRDSETRRRIYLDRESDEVRRQAADVRRRMRVGKGMAQPRDEDVDGGGNEAPVAPAKSANSASTPEGRILERLTGRKPRSFADTCGAPTRVGAVVPSVGAYMRLPGTTEIQAGRSQAPNVSCTVGATGFEPATSCSRSRRATGLRYAPCCRRARKDRRQSETMGG